MLKNNQSPVPDLIYEEQQHQRVADIYSLLRPNTVMPIQLPLHRLTVFLTYACNLACPYCKTIVRDQAELKQYPQRGQTYHLEHFKQLLTSMENTPIQHLHFTGGEATLIPALPDMVQLAKSHCIPFVSLTSNGTQPLETYQSLVEAGIDEIRISLDASTADMGAQLTQRTGAWNRTLKTIQALAQASRERLDFFLIVNTVVGLKNRHHLPEILKLILETGPPNDIKLITEADARDTLGNFAEQDKIVANIQAQLDKYPKNTFPLLRRKLTTVFKVDAVGLDSLPATNEAWHCYIPLTERTVDRQYYYPCSVYLREGGKPLGQINESQIEQREKTLHFVQEENCLSDPICQKYCLHCTREFNLKANQAKRMLC